METLIKVVSFLVVALGTYIAIHLRNRKNKKNSSSYISDLISTGPDIDELNTSLNFKVSTTPISTGASDRLFGRALEQIGKFSVKYQKQIGPDRLFLVTESVDEDLVPILPGRHSAGVQGTADIFHMQRFLIRRNGPQNNIEVYSDIYETTRDKIVKGEFAFALFEYLDTGETGAIQS
jgi:hypothetical protein